MSIEIVRLADLDPMLVGTLVGLVDSVFLEDRQRSGTLVHRYPNVFAGDNWSNIYCAVDDDRIVGSVVTRPFRYLHRRLVRRAVMVGLVCVRRELRGRGVGRELMATVTATLKQSKSQAVLWTTIPEYYAKLGWLPYDRGVFGMLPSSGKCEKNNESKVTSYQMNHMETIRDAWLDSRVIRQEIDYRVVPSAVSSVTCLIKGEAPPDAAYVLIGQIGGRAYVYEMVGNPDSFNLLTKELQGTYGEVFVNDCLGSASCRWFSNVVTEGWQMQQQSMYLNVEIDDCSENVCHVAYFDRI